MEGSLGSPPLLGSLKQSEHVLLIRIVAREVCTEDVRKRLRRFSPVFGRKCLAAGLVILPWLTWSVVVTPKVHLDS